MVYKWIRKGFGRLPHQCLLCAELLHTEDDLCPGCKSDLVRNHNACPCCAEPLEQAAICGHCLQSPPSVEAVIAPYLYQPPLDALLHQFKFQQRPGLAQCLGSLMLEGLASCSVNLPQCLIPVPLHRYRQSLRGYNQANELAKIISADLQIPIDNSSCQRTRYTAAQSTLHRKQRRKNLKGAFRIKLQQDWSHVVLIDDVCTTGHTLNSLASGLLAAGVSRVDAWVLAKTAEHH